MGDRYFHFFHGCASPVTGGPSRGVATDCWYNVGVYTFEAIPPFRVLAMTPVPILWGSRSDNLRIDYCPYHAVAFPCGALFEGGKFVVTMGWNDRRIMRAEWTLESVERALTQPPPAPRTPTPVPDMRHVTNGTRSVPARIAESGPGTELKKLLESLGLTPVAGCGCESRVATMNQWGVPGCESRRPEIESWLRAEAAKLGWGQTLLVAARAAKAVTTGIAPFLNPVDPAPGLLTEALRRATDQFHPVTESPT